MKSGEKTVSRVIDSDGKDKEYRSNWNVAMDGFLILAYTGYQRYLTYQGTKYLYDEPVDEYDFKIMLAHEIGHLLGLMDAYTTSNDTGKRFSVDVTPDEIPKEDIMRGEDPKIRRVTSNDIEMILNAWMNENSIQNFYDYIMGNENYFQSKVIKISKSI